jgi:8-oxo-dGTP diphosphatase
VKTETFCYPHPHPAVTTDVVLFTILGQRLKILLIKRAGEPFAGSWALPGGFLEIDEDLDACAQRELQEETGIRDVYVEQLYTFGRPDRDPRERVISVVYYALVPAERLNPQPGSDATATGWFALEALPNLAFDHREVIAMAHRRLVAKLDYSTIAFHFLPETFTLGELQQVYETLRGEAVDKRNFRKWVLALSQIEATGELRRSGVHRPARVYRLNNREQVEILR